LKNNEYNNEFGKIKGYDSLLWNKENKQLCTKINEECNNI